MNRPFLLAVLSLVTTGAMAADLPAVPATSIARKKELLFADDFEGKEPAKVWHNVIPAFTVEQGVLKGTQTRLQNLPASKGQRAVTAHAAVHGLEIPTQDSIVEAKIRFNDATMLSVEFDDRQYTNSHYGHICRTQIRTNGVTILDERDGSMRNDIREMARDPAKKTTRAKLLVGRQVTYPVQLESGKWYNLVVETAGDAMRVTLDGRPVAFLRSSGIAHPTKSKIELGVIGKDGAFDDLRVWNAEPVLP